MKYETNQPCVRGRASILTTTVCISFYEQHQVDEIFTYLVEKGYTFDFEVKVGDSLTLDEHSLMIHDISWANNVVELFEKLAELDYNTGLEEENGKN